MIRTGIYSPGAGIGGKDLYYADPEARQREAKSMSPKQREKFAKWYLRKVFEAEEKRCHRDATMVLVAYRHGLRAAELVDLRWEQIDFRTATLHVRRVKQGTPSTHPILGDELRALRRRQREQEPRSHFVFTSERGAPFTTAGFARMIERAGKLAKLSLKAHPAHAQARLRVRAR
jgi:integrase